MCQTLKYYQDKLHNLTAYASVVLFTSDSPSPKDKKAEVRCNKIINSFYNYSNYVQLFSSLREVEINYKMGRNEIIINQIITSSAALHAAVQHHSKDVLLKCKSEAVLVSFYSTVENKSDEELWGICYKDLYTLCRSKGILLTASELELKTLYFSVYKECKNKLKTSWFK